VFTEQDLQLQSYRKAVSNLEAMRDQLETKLLESTQQLQEEKSGYEQQLRELTKSHQVLFS
jgi:DNA-binding transcriptional MerR regulator